MVDPGGHAGTRSGLRKGIALASCCLCLLGVMPIIVNARPDTSAAVTFAFWLSFWQLLFGLPLQIREWRSGERGVLARGPDAGGNRRTVMITLVTGSLFALSTWGYVLAFQKVGTVNAAIALQVYPLFAAGLEAILLRRGRTLSELGFIILIVIAVYDLATQGTWRMSGMSAWFAVALAVPLLWSVAHVILREVLVTTQITPNQVTSSRLLVSMLFLLPLALVVDGPAELTRTAIDVPGQQVAVIMGLAYYGELILWFHAVSHIDVSIASAITVPAPAVTLLLAMVFFGERVHTFQVVALSLMMIGLGGLLRATCRRASTPAPPTTAGSDVRAIGEGG
jgi:drug/metabolite transporter (DMT)-like permease